jgi:fused signal recognition particle receptor
MFTIFKNLFNRGNTGFDSQEMLDNLEESLLTADCGPDLTKDIVTRVRKNTVRLKSPDEFHALLKSMISDIFRSLPVKMGIDDFLDVAGLKVLLFCGVNGTGKTSSLAKMAMMLKGKGLKIMAAAGDTFRAAAIEQLEILSQRVGIPLVRQRQGSDSGAVIFDAIVSAEASGIDVLLADTAGRMHTNTDLMRELEKIDKVMQKKVSPDRIARLVVIDSQTGQNAFRQVGLFKELFPVAGAIITKMDSGFKAGIVLRLYSELQVPVLFTTHGESLDDLKVFDSAEFVNDLLPPPAV